MRHLQLIQQRQVLTQYQQKSLSILSASHNELVSILKEYEQENPLLSLKWISGESGQHPDLSAYIPAPENYFDELSLLFRCTVTDPVLQAFGLMLIKLIDNKGFLHYSKSELCKILNTSDRVIAHILDILREIDVPGIASFDLSEYLLYQLRSKPQNTEIEELIISDHLELFARKDFHKISLLLNTDIRTIHHAVQEIKSLQPYPLAGKNTGSAEYVTPDLIITLTDGVPEVSLASGLPSVSLDAFYEEHASVSEVRQWGKEYAQGVRDIISAIEQRQHTLLSIGQYITRVQSLFFTHGIAPGPLTQAEIAKALDICTSTVSRALSGKYVLFRNNLFPLKDLLSSKTSSGHSKKQINDIIVSIIDSENPATPISDADIARRLEGRGFCVSRRTITKYRQALGIPSYESRRA